MTDETREHIKVTTAVKSGRAFNGFHRDAGRIVHLVPPLPDGTSGDWFNKALCGAEPGRRGNGWTRSIRTEPTCEKCLTKMKQLESLRNERA